MGWVWVAPVAAGATGIVGVFFTWLAGLQGRQHNENLAARSQAHDLVMARLSRKAEAYVEALDIAEQIGDWAQRVRPVIDTNPPAPRPGLPDVESQSRARALILAHGSAEALSLLDIWRGHVREIATCDRLIGLGMVDPGDSEKNPWMRIGVAKQAEADARQALADGINLELARSETPPPK